MKKLKELRPVVCSWRDSKIYYGQTNSEDKYECCVIKTCGFFLGYSETSILIARDLVDDDERGVIAIPKENVITVKNI